MFGGFAGPPQIPSYRARSGVSVLTLCSVEPQGSNNDSQGPLRGEGRSAVGLRPPAGVSSCEALLELFYILVNVHLQKKPSILSNSEDPSPSKLQQENRPHSGC